MSSAGMRKHGWAAAFLAVLMANDAFAKDVAGMFLGAFMLSGGLVGLVVGAASALLTKVKFWRGAILALGLSLLPWASLLLYWNFPFPDKTLVGNLPFMIFVLLGTVPVYPVAYGLAWVFVPKNTRPNGEHPPSDNPIERHARETGARPRLR